MKAKNKQAEMDVEEIDKKSVYIRKFGKDNIEKFQSSIKSDNPIYMHSGCHSYLTKRKHDQSSHLEEGKTIKSLNRDFKKDTVLTEDSLVNFIDFVMREHYYKKDKIPVLPVWNQLSCNSNKSPSSGSFEVAVFRSTKKVSKKKNQEEESPDSFGKMSNAILAYIDSLKEKGEMLEKENSQIKSSLLKAELEQKNENDKKQIGKFSSSSQL